jgi:hypothetical protein
VKRLLKLLVAVRLGRWAAQELASVAARRRWNSLNE